jgi:hypothetical protein
MAIVQSKQQDSQKIAGTEQSRVDERLMKPGKYEITKETTFTVMIHAKEKDGRWIIMNGPGKGIESNSIIFRMWTYDEMIEMRKMATNYDSQKRVHMIDNDALNRLKIQRLMVSWTFDTDNPRLRIQHVNGVMTDEGWKAFASLQPNISSYIIDEINKVYEFNG